jgi:hypothetical protein
MPRIYMKLDNESTKYDIQGPAIPNPPNIIKTINENLSSENKRVKTCRVTVQMRDRTKMFVMIYPKMEFDSSHTIYQNPHANDSISVIVTTERTFCSFPFCTDSNWLARAQLQISNLVWGCGYVDNRPHYLALSEVSTIRPSSRHSAHVDNEYSNNYLKHRHSTHVNNE